MFMIEEDKITCLTKTKLSLCDLGKSTKSQPSNQACKKKGQGGYRKLILVKGGWDTCQRFREKSQFYFIE